MDKEAGELKCVMGGWEIIREEIENWENSGECYSFNLFSQLIEIQAPTNSLSITNLFDWILIIC